jgi:type VI secretion system protein ImpL
MTAKAWLRIVFYIIGVFALSGLVWFGGPMLSVGTARPFDGDIMRFATIGVLGLSTLLYAVFDIVYRLRSSKEIAKNLAGMAGIPGATGAAAGADAGPQDDSETLRERMTDALSTLKKTGSGKGDYLYDLPWYVIIGPPGSGKTTALINSGLKFPLARGGAAPAAIAGVGGTRYCDWWFTEDAVLIDTAGRYTTQDSDQKADRGSWLAFLDLLKKNRPKQPINGVLICISIADVLRLPPAEVRAHADAIRARLLELHTQLKVDFPVYAVFTKADLVSGFLEFFGHVNESVRKEVWGATFQTRDKTANMVVKIPEEFDLLIDRLNQDVVDRVQDEPNPTARVQLFAFPSQMAALKEPVFNFLNQVFEPTRYHSNATLRGFYFTSGTQEGTPIDQLIGAISRSFGTVDEGQSGLSGLGKSFFLTDLMQKVIFKEAGWVSTNLRAVRRSMILKGLAYSLLVTICAGAAGAWWMSYRRNNVLIGDSVTAITQFRTVLGNKGLRDETVISDADFVRVLDPLNALRGLPAGFAVRSQPTEIWATFGLNQRPRINTSAESAYDIGLNRLFRPRLMLRLEQVLRDSLARPSSLPEPLKVYLMVANKLPLERQFIVDWWRAEWSERYPGAANASGRDALIAHLERTLDIDPPEGSAAIDIDPALVQEAQSAIGRMTLADRAFEILRSAARQDPSRDWTVRARGGQDVVRVFEGANGADLASIRVPYFFTYDGFHEAFLGRIDDVVERMRKERPVLGDVAAQTALAAQYERLPRELLEIYRTQFRDTWTRELKKLRVKLLTADRPQYFGLQAAAAPTSPFVQLIESIRDETALTKERPKAAGQGQAQAKPAPKLALSGGRAPGADIEDDFRTFHQLVEGDRGKRRVDEMTRFLSELHTALTLLNDPVRAAQGRQQFAESLKSLQATATQFPDPFKILIQNAAAAFDNDATSTIVARIHQSLGEQVTNVCRDAINGAFPFVSAGRREIDVQTFQKVFGPNGIIERYFLTNLAQYANTSGARWNWVQANPVGRQLPPGMIRSFQQAAEIRQAFFPGGAPGFSFAVKNLALSEGIETARLVINSQQLQTDKPKPPPPPPAPSLFGSSPPPPPPQPPPGPPPVVMFQWPGPVGLGGAALTVGPDIPGRISTVTRPGPWGIFRLLQAASVSRSGEALVVRLSVGGREASYQINAVTLPNPFTLASLRDFTCPTSR